MALFIRYLTDYNLDDCDKSYREWGCWPDCTFCYLKLSFPNFVVARLAYAWVVKCQKDYCHDMVMVLDGLPKIELKK